MLRSDAMDDDRLEREREFFDAATAEQGIEPPPPTEHVERLLALLGDPTGKRVLDCGCGGGDLALEIAARGGRVVGFDLSEESVRLMRKRATALGAAAPGLVSLMERLPFPDACFDAIVGKSILHHVEVGPSLGEVRRVLAPGGRAVFIENQMTNPTLRLARRLTGRFGIARVGTPDEHPLVEADYRAIRGLFPHTRLEYPDFRFFGLFSRNVLRYRRALWLARLLARLDAWIYRRLPFLRRWGYHVIVEVRKAG